MGVQGGCCKRLPQGPENMISIPLGSLDTLSLPLNHTCYLSSVYLVGLMHEGLILPNTTVNFFNL
jgi:hypothetical protein